MRQGRNERKQPAPAGQAVYILNRKAIHTLPTNSRMKNSAAPRGVMCRRSELS